MTPEQTKAWLTECLKDESLFDHERALLEVMIRCLPVDNYNIQYIEKRPLYTDRPELMVDLSDAKPGEVVVVSITTSKNKKLQGPDLAKFNQFWDAYDYKRSRAEAAQAWIDIPDTKDEPFMEQILYAARQTASERKPAVTPKMAQGWLSARRWEDYEGSNAQSPDQWTIEKWKETLDGAAGIFMSREKSWAEYMPGPNPWEQRNTEIPSEVHRIYAEKWNWK